MSNLIKMVEVHDTGMRTVDPWIKPRIDPFDMVDVNYSYDSSICKQIRVQVKIAATAIVPFENTRVNVQEMVIDDIKNQITETVFGEFRKPIMKIRDALNNRDIESARNLLIELESSMFNINTMR